MVLSRASQCKGPGVVVGRLCMQAPEDVGSLGVPITLPVSRDSLILCVIGRLVI